MTMNEKDINILQALYNDNHLNDQEIKRAIDLIHGMNFNLINKINNSSKMLEYQKLLAKK